MEWVDKSQPMVNPYPPGPVSLKEQYYSQKPMYSPFAAVMRANPVVEQNFREVMGRVPIMSRVAEMLLAPVDPLAMATFGGQKATGFAKAEGKFSNMADKKVRFEISDDKANLMEGGGAAMSKTSFMPIVELPQGKFTLKSLNEKYPTGYGYYQIVDENGVDAGLGMVKKIKEQGHGSGKKGSYYTVWEYRGTGVGTPEEAIKNAVERANPDKYRAE